MRRSPLLAAIIAWVLSRTVFRVIGHTYRPFTDPFDATQLAIDLGVWLLAFALVSWLISTVASRRT